MNDEIFIVDGIKVKLVNRQWIPVDSQVLVKGVILKDLAQEINEAYLDFFTESQK